MSRRPDRRPARRTRGLLQAALVVQFLAVGLDVALEARLIGTQQAAPGGMPGVLVSALTLLSFPIVGVLLLRRTDHRIARLLCLLTLGFAVTAAAGSYARLGLAAAPGSVPAPEVAVWLYTWTGLPGSALLLVMVLLFPDGRLPSPRWRWLGWVIAGWGVAGALILALAPGRVDDTIGVAADNPVGMGTPGPWWEALTLLGYPAFVPLALIAVVAVVGRFRRAGGIQRQQLKWFVSSVALVAVMTVLQLAAFAGAPAGRPLPDWVMLVSLIAIASTATIPVAVAVAVLRHRLYDIDRLLNRTLVYTVVTGLLAAVYLVAVTALQGLLAPLTGESQLAVAGSTLAVAALFRPLRERVQAAVDRRFDRARYDAARTVQGYRDVLRDELELDHLTAALLGAVDRTVQPRSAALWLRSGARETL